MQNIVCVTHFVTVSKETMEKLEECLLKPVGTKEFLMPGYGLAH
jgi:hypothetical protein